MQLEFKLKHERNEKENLYALSAFSCSSGVPTNVYSVNITVCPPGYLSFRSCYFFVCLCSLKKRVNCIGSQHSKLSKSNHLNPNSLSFLSASVIFCWSFIFVVFIWISVHVAVTIVKGIFVSWKLGVKVSLSPPVSRLQHSSYQKHCMKKKFTRHLLRLAVFVCMHALVCACKRVWVRACVCACVCACTSVGS